MTDVNAALRRVLRGEPAPAPIQENSTAPRRISADAGAGQTPDSTPTRGYTDDLNAALRAAARGRRL